MKPNSGALRYFARIKNGTTPASSEPEYWDGNVRWATPEDLGKLTSDKIFDTKRLVTEKAVAECNLTVLPVGSIIISTRAPIGHMAINQIPMGFNQGCRGIIPKEQIYGPFLYHLVKSRTPELNATANGTTFVELSRHDLASMFIKFPPFAVQQRISRFLDEKTARIDRLIAKKRELLNLMAEKRQALITKTVTKGLNPNVQMKPSGIDWLGDIPAHWEIRGLTKCTSRIDYRGATPEKSNSGVFLVTAKNIKNGQIDYESSKEYIPEETYEYVMRRGKPQLGEVLFTTEAPLGEVARVDHADIALAQRIIKFSTALEGLLNAYLAYWMYSSAFRSDVVRRATGSTAVGIKASKIVELRCLLPPKYEQAKISKFLDKDAAARTVVAKKIQTSIERLSEYRAALTTATVTGQIAEMR
ncbi:MAG: restriction endonuclease subunit S [Gemmatimonadetes bacterium]|nr:restriction endonuclease subunit S [Gemmatimonadota bacterium]